MKTYGRAAMADLLGDMIAFRSLHPVDRRVPGLVEIAPRLGLPTAVPRKGDEAYAQVVTEMLRAARALDAPGVELHRMLFIGDTRHSDGGAFATLCAATGWDGRAFIAAEDPGQAPASATEGAVTFANRWSALQDFARQLDVEGFAIDAATVVVLDIDKTLIGARGRNDQLIDAARLRALQQSVAGVLGDTYDAALFRTIFQTLNTARFHPLTADNQDYVGYLCAMIAGGAVSLDDLTGLAAAGRLPGFAAFLVHIASTCVASGWPSPALEAFHTDIAGRVATGDPTPFKAFRWREFAETAARMGTCPDETPPEDLLRDELVLTAEVWSVSADWRARGALLFGLSDKPDEAALPDPSDLLPSPLHRIATHIVGWVMGDG
jgi:hypothetical protein